jgi:mannitol-1-phosphate/altronate dehydrogenase
LTRLEAAQTRQVYDLLFSNCEQFARFVIEGESYSTQARKVMLIAGLMVGGYFAFKYA